MKQLLLIFLVAISISVYGQGNRELIVDFGYLFSGQTPVQIGSSEHAHTDGATVKFDLINYYVSNIRLVPITGTEVSFDTVLLVRGDNVGPFTIGEVPVGTYNSIKFDIGVDSITNHGDPSVYASSHPLAYTSMFWSWNSGYIFMKVEGELDTTVAQTAGPTLPFEYHVGADVFRKEVTVPITDLVVDANTQTLAANIDLILSNVLGNLDLINAADIFTHTMDNIPLATTVANNFQTAFVGEVTKTQLSAINDIEASSIISLYPNPLVGQSTLKVSNGDVFSIVEVLDITGKIIFTQTLDGGNIALNRSQFPAAGIYMVKVQGESTAVRKLVVY